MSEKSFREEVLSGMAWQAEKLATHPLDDLGRAIALAKLDFATGLFEKNKVPSELAAKAKSNFNTFAAKCGDEKIEKRLRKLAEAL